MLKFKELILKETSNLLNKWKEGMINTKIFNLILRRGRRKGDRHNQIYLSQSSIWFLIMVGVIVQRAEEDSTVAKTAAIKIVPN